MKNEEYTQIFVAEKQSFLDKNLPSDELKNFLVEHIIKLEKQCETDYMTIRSKISAALSLIDDDATHIKLSRALKESKVTPKNERVFTHAKGQIGIDGRPDPGFKLEQAEAKKEQKEANAWKIAVKAFKMFTNDPQKIYTVLKTKYPKLTVDMVKDELK